MRPHEIDAAREREQLRLAEVLERLKTPVETRLCLVGGPPLVTWGCGNWPDAHVFESEANALNCCFCKPSTCGRCGKLVAPHRECGPCRESGA